MDTVISLLQQPIGAWSVALFYGLVVGALLSRLLVAELWKAVDDELRAEWPNTSADKQKVVPRYEWQGVLVGITERLLYIPAIAIGRPEFLLLWLTLKTVARARRWTEDALVPGRAILNTFLIGNATSIAFALVSAGMIEWLAGPSWAQDPLLALVVPTALAALVLALWAWLRLHARPNIGKKPKPPAS